MRLTSGAGGALRRPLVLVGGGLALAMVAQAGRADCGLQHVGATPLPDMHPMSGSVPARGGGAGTVMVGGALLSGPFQGGLYPGGQQHAPPLHLAAAMAAAGRVTPRLPDGTADPAGAIGLLSVGISNTTHMFSNPPRPPGTPGCTPPGSPGSPCPAAPWMPASVRAATFKSQMDVDPSRSPNVTLVDGALGGADAVTWATWSTNQSQPDPANPWFHVTNQLAAATPGALTDAQVQVVWLKSALLSPHTFTRGAPGTQGNFPDHASLLRDQLAITVRALKARFPNLQLLYLSSRMRGFNATTGGNREPWAYESSFGIKWLIEDQIADEDEAGHPGFSSGLSHSAGEAPVLLWGPYLWAEGDVPRSDGRLAVCDSRDPFLPGNEFLSDVRAYNDMDPTTDPMGSMYDYTHPGGGGIQKNANQLVAFFKSHPTSVSWFLRPEVGIPALTMTPPAGAVTSGVAPLAVSFSAAGSTMDATWDYDDGTGFRGTVPPVKTFFTPGTYQVHMTGTDAAGNRHTQRTTVVVEEPGSGTSSGSTATSGLSGATSTTGSTGSGAMSSSASGSTSTAGASGVGVSSSAPAATAGTTSGASSTMGGFTAGTSAPGTSTSAATSASITGSQTSSGAGASSAVTGGASASPPAPPPQAEGQRGCVCSRGSRQVGAVGWVLGGLLIWRRRWRLG